MENENEKLGSISMIENKTDEQKIEALMDYWKQELIKRKLIPLNVFACEFNSDNEKGIDLKLETLASINTNAYENNKVFILSTALANTLKY